MPARYRPYQEFYTTTVNLGANSRGEIRTVQTFENMPGIIAINSRKVDDPVEKQQVILVTYDELETIYRSVEAARRQER